YAIGFPDGEAREIFRSVAAPHYDSPELNEAQASWKHVSFATRGLRRLATSSDPDTAFPIVALPRDFPSAEEPSYAQLAGYLASSRYRSLVGRLTNERWILGYRYADRKICPAEPSFDGADLLLPP